MEEWKEYKLGELCEILDSKRIPLSSSQREKRKGCYPYYGAQGIIDYVDDYIFDGTYLLVAEDGENLKSRKQDIAQLVSGKYWVNNHAHILGSNGTSDIRLLCYILNKTDISGYITGSAQPKLNQANMQSIKLTLPSLPTQQKIANILSSLDDKIEVNRRINEQLEELAQALFKSWFVDFEPFKDGEFVDSELGMIPKGWKVGYLKEFCSEIVRGYTPKYAEFSDYPILNQKVNKGNVLDVQYYKYNKNDDSVPQNKMAQRGDVYLNSLGQGTLGRVHLYKNEISNVIVDQFITILRTDSFVKSAYLAYLLKSKFYQNEIESRITGSTGMWVLTINNIRGITIVEPLDNIWSELDGIIEPIYNKIATNVEEITHLTTLRDTLLPKLMSGEIDVNEVEI